ncbi:MAG: cysteine--tRNA ligase, partial [Thermoplasmata archaeon]|nr:cysteine--tRNA ligase [Thermoplasmata archaeon]
AGALARLEQLSSDSLSTLLSPFDWANEVLGLCGGVPLAESTVVPEVVQASLDARARARDRGDFPEADRIRDALAAAGIVVEDHGGVTRWRLRGTTR